MAVTPHGVLHRDSHEIPPTVGGGTQVADFTRGFIKGKITKNLRRRNGGCQGDPGPLIENPIAVSKSQEVITTATWRSEFNT